jgi:hypothetical protein
MSNHTGNLTLKVITIDKGEVNEKSLQEILELDADFSMNEVMFRPDTLKKGFNNEAERISSEIFKKNSKKISAEDDELGLVGAMLTDVFKVKNFIGDSSFYEAYDYHIVETDFQYVISIAYTT